MYSQQHARLSHCGTMKLHPPRLIEEHIHVCLGRLPRPVAAHFTPCGGWVEFHPEATSPADTHPIPDAFVPSSSHDHTQDESAGSPSDPSPRQPPELHPLLWFRFCTEEEHQIYSSVYGDQHEAISLEQLQAAGVGLPVWWRSGLDLTGAALVLT